MPIRLNSVREQKQKQKKNKNNTKASKNTTNKPLFFVGGTMYQLL